MGQMLLQHTKKRRLTRRWLIVLLGLAVQLGIILLLFLSANQPGFFNIALTPVQGHPGVCQVTGVAPFSDPARQGIHPGTLVRPQSGPGNAGNAHPCQPTNGSVMFSATGGHQQPGSQFTVESLSSDLADTVLVVMLAIIFDVAGIAIFLRAQARPTARIAYALFYSVSLYCCGLRLQSLHIHLLDIIFPILQILINGFSTTFVCLFPHPRSQQFHRKRASFLPYVPLGVGIIIALLSLPIARYISNVPVIPLFLNFGYNIVCLIIVICVLLWGMRNIDNSERQLARIMIISVAFLLVIMALSQGIMPQNALAQHSLIPSGPFSQPGLLHLIPFPLVVLPIICDYALFRHELVGATSLLSRKVMRVFLWILLASLFIFPGIILLRALDSSTLKIVQDLRDYVYAALLVLCLWLFPLLWNKLRDAGDLVFYHDFYQYNRSLSDLSTAMTRLHGLDQISAFLLPRLSQLLNAPDVILLVRAISQDEMRYSTDDINSTTRAWHLYRSTPQGDLSSERLSKIADQALRHFTRRSYAPHFLDDVLLLALYDGDQVTGFLCLGPKKNLEPYGRQDKSFLATLVAQLSVLEVNNRYLVQAQADAQKVTALNHRVISAQEDERKHLALDLHDDVLQGAMLLVRQLSDASSISDIADAMPLARSVVTNLRRTCLALRPSLLDELGLAEALRWLVKQTEQLSAGKLRLELRCVGVTTQRFSGMVELALYRVAQEALANVMKHAQASKVIVRLHYSRHGQISLVIADNGRGFRMGRLPEESLGFVGMYERMDAIGGYIQLRARPYRGVIVRAIYTQMNVEMDISTAKTVKLALNRDVGSGRLDRNQQKELIR